jgi:effector-binding domain-containing protein
MPISEVPARFGPLVDRVWQFVRDAGLTTNHNVFVYHDGGDGNALVEFGVQVATPFDDDSPDGVQSSATPSGTVARTLHVGPYDGLAAAHEAVRSWCAEHARAIAGPAWEIYGDWDEDSAKLETEVLYRLAE